MERFGNSREVVNTINTLNIDNFLDLVQLLGKIYPVMMEHLPRVINKENNVY